MEVALYIVPTPIGNLKDITFRAVEVLQQVDAILCEDTRTSGHLLKHYNIAKPLVAHHMHNEHKVVDRLVEEMKGGKVYALITDAGTPAISDPGFLLVRACLENELKVNCLPGATAFVPALVQSGIPSTSFVFEGFLPQKKGRLTKFTAMAQESRTQVFYESPFRLVKTLEELMVHCGPERKVSVSRELSKMFEETKTGTLQEVAAHFKANGIKGEIVVVLAGKE